MTSEEKRPILQETSGVFVRNASGQYQPHQSFSDQQHLIIQPIEFNYKHRNLYGYYALAAAILVITNLLMIKQRTCQISLANGYQNYDLIQSFHITTLIVCLMVFVLSYFDFAVIIHEFKMIFYSGAALIFVCSGLLAYNFVTIVSSPCVAMSNPFGGLGGLVSTIDSGSVVSGTNNIFSAHDGIGITVFLFDIVAAVLVFLTGRNFYKRS